MIAVVMILNEGGDYPDDYEDEVDFEAKMEMGSVME